MAKRKRLTPANPAFLPEVSDSEPPVLETKSAIPRYKDGWEGVRKPAAPISAVAGDAAATSALAELADEMAQARRSGRMVLDLPISAIAADHLVRDRAHVDADEMAVLKASLSERGQQTPVEVTDLGGGRYGLISGWRRLEALKQLKSETVKAFLRKPQDGADAYLAMVEENEIRASLSFYERARIVVQATAQGVFDSEKSALKALFRALPRARRSKIGSFVPVVQALDGVLQHPQGLTEKHGLILSRALGEDPRLAGRLELALKKGARDAQEEWSIIGAVLGGSEPKAAKPVSRRPLRLSPQVIAPGVTLRATKPGQMILEGEALTADLRAQLCAWLQQTLSDDTPKK